MTTLYLVCWMMIRTSNITLAIPDPPDPNYIESDCKVFGSLKNAAIANYERAKRYEGPISDGGNLFYLRKAQPDVRYYKIMVGETPTIEPINAPTVRLEVDEK